MLDENVESEVVENQEVESEVIGQEQSTDTESDFDPFAELGLDRSKYGLTENEEEDTEVVEDGEEAPAGDVQENGILEQINKLGLVHNDTDLKVESVEQLKNLVQQGFDYTKKTQSLADERKSFEVEKGSAEKELMSAIEDFNKQSEGLSAQLQELELWGHTIERMKSEAPDVFEEVQALFDGTRRQYDNPMFKNQIESLRKEFSETQNSLKQRENQAIIDQFEREKGSMGDIEKSMSDLGIKVDWDKVKSEWVNTGMDLKKVVGSLYFESITKAQASKEKVAATKTAATKRPVGTGTSSRPGRVQTEVKYDGSIDNLIHNIAKKYRS